MAWIIASTPFWFLSFAIFLYAVTATAVFVRVFDRLSLPATKYAMTSTALAYAIAGLSAVTAAKIAGF